MTNRRDVIKGSLALAARSAVLPGVTATLASCGGSDGPTLSAPTALSYSSPATGTVGTALTTLSPTVTGTVSNYTVAPALPAGLSLNANTGTISGTPSAVVAQAAYVVTASNAAGTATFSLSITINPAIVLSAANVSPTALTPLTVTATGLDLASAFTVSLAVGTATVTLTPIRTAAASNELILALPLNIDPATGNTASTTATLSVTQGTFVSNALALNISDLPSVASYGTSPGVLSRGLLNTSVLGLQTTVNALVALANFPSTTVASVSSISTVVMNLQSSLGGALLVRQAVDQIASGYSTSLNGGSLSDGTPITFTASSVDVFDRMAGLYLQAMGYLPGTIYPAASAIAARLPETQRQRRMQRRTREALGRPHGLESLLTSIGTLNGAYGLATAQTSIFQGQSGFDNFVAIGQGMSAAFAIGGVIVGAPSIVAAAVTVGTVYGLYAIGNDAYKWYTQSNAAAAAEAAGDAAAAAQANAMVATAEEHFFVDTIGTALGVFSLPYKVGAAVGLSEGVVSVLKTFQTEVPGVTLQGMTAINNFVGRALVNPTTGIDADVQAVQATNAEVPPASEFGLVNGTATPATEATSSGGTLPDLSGVDLSDPQTGGVILNTYVGTDGDFSLIVPLEIPSIDYATLQIYNISNDLVQGAVAAANLSTLTATTPLNLPPLPPPAGSGGGSCTAGQTLPDSFTFALTSDGGDCTGVSGCGTGGGGTLTFSATPYCATPGTSSGTLMVDGIPIPIFMAATAQGDALTLVTLIDVPNSTNDTGTTIYPLFSASYYYGVNTPPGSWSVALNSMSVDGGSMTAS